eukprot:GHVN01059728.1.p1 GENE.GHVN01059728.1~~GHVN01059728.1.p1  ORF type:complete len:212 (+),score=37.88 GHVN01059728.1:42-677(+)
MQSEEVYSEIRREPDTPNCTSIYGDPSRVNEPSLISNFEVPQPNVWECFLTGLRVAGGNSPCLGTRTTLSNGKRGPYRWKTFNEVHGLALAYGRGLMALDAVPPIEVAEEARYSPFMFMGICSISREEWCLTDLACAAFNITSVPLYETLGDEAMGYILQQTNLTTVGCSGTAIEPLLNAVSTASGGGERELLKGVKVRTIIAFDSVSGMR